MNLNKVYSVLSLAAVTTVAVSFASCDSEDEYYESGNYTLAAHRMTRSYENTVRQEVEVTEPFVASFKFKCSKKPDSVVVRSVSGCIVFMLDTARYMKGRPTFYWDTAMDLDIYAEDASYNNNKLEISAKARYNGGSDFNDASWSDIYARDYSSY